MGELVEKEHLPFSSSPALRCFDSIPYPFFLSFFKSISLRSSHDKLSPSMQASSPPPSWRGSMTSRLFGVEVSSSSSTFSRPCPDFSTAQFSIFDKETEVSPSSSTRPPPHPCCPLCLLTLSNLSSSIGKTPSPEIHLPSSSSSSPHLIDLLDDISVILFLRLCLYHTSDLQETHVSLPSSSSPSTLSSLEKQSRIRRTVEKPQEPCRYDDEQQLTSSSSSSSLASRHHQSAVQGRDNRRLLKRDNRRTVGHSPLWVPNGSLRTEGVAVTDSTENPQKEKPKRGMSQQIKSSLSNRKKRKRRSPFSSSFLFSPSCYDAPSQSQLLRACREGLSTLFSPGASFFPPPRCIYTRKKSPRMSQDTQQHHHNDRFSDPFPPSSSKSLFSHRRVSFHREERREDRKISVQSQQPFPGGGEEKSLHLLSSSPSSPSFFESSSSSFRDCGQKKLLRREKEPPRKVRDNMSTEKEAEDEDEDCDMGEREESFTRRQDCERKEDEVCCCLHRYFPSSHDEVRDVEEDDEGERERRRKIGESYEDTETLVRLGRLGNSERQVSSSLLSSSSPSFLLSKENRSPIPSSMSYIGVLHLLHAQLSSQGLPGVWVWVELLHLIKKSRESFSFFFDVLQDVFSLLSWSSERIVLRFLRHLSSPNSFSSPLLYGGDTRTVSLRKGGEGSSKEEEDAENEDEEKDRKRQEVEGGTSGVDTLERARDIPWRRRKHRLFTAWLATSLEHLLSLVEDDFQAGPHLHSLLQLLLPSLTPSPSSTTFSSQPSSFPALSFFSSPSSISMSHTSPGHSPSPYHLSTSLLSIPSQLSPSLSQTYTL
ncbi:hypothetical protein CSUI_000347, partial [Cystoisospora suis]